MTDQVSRAVIQQWCLVKVAARLLDVPERAIRRAVAAGKIRCYRASPRVSWILWEDASEWAKARCR